MSESESMSLQEEPQKQNFSSKEDSLKQEEQFQDEYLTVYPESDMEMEQEGEDHRRDLGEESSKIQSKKGHKEEYTAQFEIFKKVFEESPDLEGQLQSAIDFMEASLAQGGTPHFRSFWEARRLCLPLFKENISPLLRSQLWNKYSELSKEARRLKEILDEQSAFAVEQIEIAVEALEQDISQFQEQIEKTSFPTLADFPQILKNHYSVYQDLQKQLNVFNVQASRINALRKELLKTEMRVRHKNKFFQRLSSAGDQVFPKRKELIKQISQQFTNDVEQFIQTHFGPKASHESLFILREEIKSLQSLAKILTLNTHSFTNTRTRLSKCWDQIKAEEKERKKERAQQKAVFKQNFEEIQQQIQTLQQVIEKHEEPLHEAQKKMEGIVAQMRKVELGRDELKKLREALTGVRQLIQTKIKGEEEARQQQENERNRQKKEKYRNLKEQVERLLLQHETQDVEKLLVDRESLIAQIQETPLTKNEKQELERLLKPLKDIITEKKEKALLDLSEDDRQSLQQLKNILQQRKERRQEVKNQLEILRKAAGSSSLDFEKAMGYNIQMNEEKERLEKANQGIREIERKISELQSKLKVKN